MAKKEATSIRVVASLGIAGLLSGMVLVGLYLVTLPIIQQNRIEALNRAIFHVLEGTVEITPMHFDGDKLQVYDGELTKAPKGEMVYAGRDADGKLVGYAVPAQGPGFQDAIVLIYGFDPVKRAVIGFEVLESRETPGLGDKIITDEHFLANFDALGVEPKIVGVKIGAKTAPNHVDTITGATISSKAVINILNGSMAQWLDVLAPKPEPTPRKEARR